MTHASITGRPVSVRAVFSPSVTAVPFLACLAACAPELPPLRPSSGATDGELEPGADLEITPAAPLDAAPPVLRFHVRVAAATAEDVDLDRIFVIQGEVGAAHLRQIEQDDLSKALSGRVVSSIAWIEERSPRETWVTVAPLAALTGGQTYAVAGGSPVFAHHIQVATETSPPVLPRLWPPSGAAASFAIGVWCGEARLAEGAVEAQLAPGGPDGLLARGAIDGIGARCVRFEAPPQEHLQEDERRFVGPPSVGSEPPAVSLDPRPFVLESEPLPATPARCERWEVPFGPGCAEVADDRIHVRSADVPLLWAIAGEGLDEVRAAEPGDPFMIAPLPPLARIALVVAAMDNAGQVERHAFSAWTLAPMPHVIINEVLANPLGPEPASEWVELYNDGSAPAELARYVLSDVGGETELPSATLLPGAYALVVNEAFVAPEEDDELDPSPPPEALLLRVPKLGKNGLSNTGEPLKLKDAGGAILSRSPAIPAQKTGMSLVRVRPSSPDGLDGSFVSSWPTPGRENIIVQEML